jgi:Cys-rich four helix bundle protein (predicted Tat secretion target)
MMNEGTAVSSASDMSRRHALRLGGALLATGAALGSSMEARAEHAGHEHHGGDHAHHAHASSKHQALIDAAQRCVASAEACVPHCVALLGKGDTSLAECLESVLEMAPVCTAVVRLAALDAGRLKELAKVCSDICADCEKVCRKHAEHHEVCKVCADSCAAFIKESKKLTDA